MSMDDLTNRGELFAVYILYRILINNIKILNNRLKKVRYSDFISTKLNYLVD